MTRSIGSFSCYNTRFVEERLTEFLRDPESVSAFWRQWFSQLDGKETIAATRRPLAKRCSVFNSAITNRRPGDKHLELVRLHDRVGRLVRAFARGGIWLPNSTRWARHELNGRNCGRQRMVLARRISNAAVHRSWRAGRISKR